MLPVSAGSFLIGGLTGVGRYAMMMKESRWRGIREEGRRSTVKKWFALVLALTVAAGCMGVALAESNAREMAQALIVRKAYDHVLERCLALAEQGDLDALYEAGWHYLDNPFGESDDMTALQGWKRAAEQGHAESRQAMAKFYSDSFGPYSELAEQGDPEGYYFLGKVYRAGITAEPDIATAVTYFERAATLDHRDSCVYLGHIYQHGELGEPDSAKAIEYYTKAAALGDPYACYTLGDIYYAGEGGEPDEVTALRYYTLAFENGYRNDWRYFPR